jgi:hypothetical protein
MQPISAQLFEQVISKPRLDSYKGYFQAKPEEAVGLYMWNCELTSCFASLLAFFEIVLRNNVHRSMSRYVSRGTSDSMHWYDTYAVKAETLRKVQDVRGNRNLSPDEIVSGVTFGFWTVVLSSIGRRDAVTVLPNIFPHHPLNSAVIGWGDDPTRKRALAFIYELKNFRNRIAHHEPLWKFGALMDTSVRPAVTVLPGSLTAADSISRLQRLLGFIDAAVHTLEPQLQLDMRASSWRRKLDYLLSARGIARYRGMKHSPPAMGVSPTFFRRSFGLVVKANQPIYVRRAAVGGIFIPD